MRFHALRRRLPTGATPLARVWKQCYLWSFPYYLVGAAMAGIIVYYGRTAGWVMPLGILPLMWMIYFFYRTWVQRVTGTA
jgi:hypothetical protein